MLGIRKRKSSSIRRQQAHHSAGVRQRVHHGNARELSGHQGYQFRLHQEGDTRHALVYCASIVFR